ncbi:hypothetical protein OROHE_006087 [Orobanche hederae]
MAAPTATPPSLSLSVSSHVTESRTRLAAKRIKELTHLKREGPTRSQTKIHWESEDEGWIGGSSSGPTKEKAKDENEFLREKFSELLNSSSDSYYQFLGVPANADLEEIKAAYRILSKEYHPDTTVLPIRTASDKFMQLREIYNVLSNKEKRRFYDCTLAQEAASKEAEKMRIKMEDPYMREIERYESVPDMVDRLGGGTWSSMISQHKLTFDILVIIFSICCLIYVL